MTYKIYAEWEFPPENLEYTETELEAELTWKPGSPVVMKGKLKVTYVYDGRKTRTYRFAVRGGTAAMLFSEVARYERFKEKMTEKEKDKCIEDIEDLLEEIIYKKQPYPGWIRLLLIEKEGKTVLKHRVSG